MVSSLGRGNKIVLFMIQGTFLSDSILHTVVYMNDDWQ